jgi:hypothetical protein
MCRRKPLTAFGAAPLDNEAAVLGRHPSAEAVRLGATTIIGLKGSLRHSQQFSTVIKSERLTVGKHSVKKRGAVLAARHCKIRPRNSINRESIPALLAQSRNIRA